MLADGYEVLATGSSASSAAGAMDEMQHPALSVVALDIADDAAVREFGEGVRELDVLVNNAGIASGGGREFDPAEFARVVDVNLNGAMRVSTALRPALARSQGCIVNIASMTSFFGSGRVPAYSASKGGIVQLTKSLAIAWAPQGVRVNAVAPGWVRTRLNRHVWESEELSRPIVDRTPLGRWAEVDDIPGTVAFLCSSDAGFVTGITIPVDGGYSAS
jgi:NAD(P)-dependent dehydrogenase (short-subunit alcohol dehydrogenase family)